MIINYIEMENFLPFKEKTHVAFSSDQRKNVTLLLTENNIGKSSFLKAFIWCLYGTDKEDNNQVLNDEAKIDMEHGTIGNFKAVTVELDFTHQEIHYNLVRKWTYTFKGNTKTSIDKTILMNRISSDGSSSPVDYTDIDGIIKTMLPEDLSEYFFFEEKKFAHIGETKSIKSSVEDFCGLTILNNALRDTKKAKNFLSAKVPNSNDQKLKKRLLDREKLQSELSKWEALEKNSREQAKYYSEEADRLNQKLIDKSGDINIRNNFAREKEHLNYLTNTYNEKINDVVKEFNDNPVSFFLSLHDFQNTINLLKNIDDNETVEAPIGVTTGTIDDIIRKGRCICGAEITDGNEGYKNLMKLKRIVPPNSVSDLIKVYTSELNQCVKSSSNYLEHICKAAENIKNLQNEIEKSNKVLDDLKIKVSGTEDTDQIQQQIKEAKQKYQEFREKNNNATYNLGEIKSEYDHNEDQIRILQKNNEKGRIYLKKVDCAQKIIDSLQNDINAKQKDVLDQMNESVGGYFEKIYHGTRRLTIDPEYNIKVFNNYKGAQLDSKLSSGTNDVKNFAFVFGLEKLAKNIISVNDSENESYPLILDGPFSHVDGEHISNICEILPGISSQVIIAVSQKDWDLSKDYLKPYVGKKYKMRKITEEHTQINEVNENV